MTEGARSGFPCDGGTQLVEWVCKKTPIAFDAIKREFAQPGDRVEIMDCPTAISVPASEEQHSERESVPDWAKNLTNLPGEMEMVAARTAANTEKLDRIFKIVKDTPAAGEPLELSDSGSAGSFSLQLREHILAAAGNDPSLHALLDDSFDIENKPVEWVIKVHEHLKQSLKEFVGLTVPRINFPELVEEAKGEGVHVDEGPISLSHALKAMNGYRNLLAHPKPDQDLLKIPLATLCFVKLSIVWPHFASEQMPEELGTALPVGAAQRQGTEFKANAGPKREILSVRT